MLDQETPAGLVPLAALSAEDRATVERMRKFLAKWRRWRPWVIAFWTAMLLGVVPMLIAQSVGLLRGMVNNNGLNNAVWQGFGIGASVGMSLGTLAFGIGHQLASFVFLVGPSDRLLLRLVEDPDRRP